MPLSEKQKTMVNRASRHLYATATPATIRFKQVLESQKKCLEDESIMTPNIMVNTGEGSLRLTRFDSKNHDDMIG